MSIIEKKAFEAYQKNRELPEKYQTRDSMWMDWYTRGYRQAEMDCAPKWILCEEDLSQTLRDQIVLVRFEDGSIRLYSDDWPFERVTHLMVVPNFEE